MVQEPATSKPISRLSSPGIMYIYLKFIYIYNVLLQESALAWEQVSAVHPMSLQEELRLEEERKKKVTVLW